ncbi:uncharacterized protein LOC141637872 [Silene latifolia]|uniref:uncharacterized protein LOC141637872 n=1 Tax=Silene latifolia TaxID=37657 RepID=UPI003D78757D
MASNERIGGAPITNAEMRPLVQVVHDYQLEDLSAKGAFYTWTNKHEHGTKVYSRLDRMLFNVDWMDCFPDSYVHFLPEGLIDHCPSLIHFEGEIHRRGNPFKYFNMWSLAPDYDNIVRTGWHREWKGTLMFRVVQKLKSLKPDLKKLNKEQFGDIENLTHIAELALNQFQTMVVQDPLNEELCLSEKECATELTELRKARDQYLRQKTKCEWMEHGDDNTAYFHACTSKEVSSINQRVVRAGPILTKEHCDLLIAPITGEEVKNAMFGILGTKAPGPDGYSSQFFKDNWGIVGNDVIAVVQGAFQSGQLLKQCNNTIITLIPKVDLPENVLQFRPIAYYNTIYKCLSKVLCARLGQILPEVISASQSAFIKGRDIVGNILICQDLNKLYNRKTSSPRIMMKLDLQKAYDSLIKEIEVASGIKRGVVPFRYLGVNVSLKRLYVMDCNCLVEKVVDRIRSLGSRKLSYAGRVMLIKAVLQTLHSYWARIFILPKTVIGKIEAICRAYLWHGSDHKESSGLVSWENICQSKKHGGLGLKDLHVWNLATIGKYAWWIAQKEDHLWVRWVNAVYIKSTGWMEYKPRMGSSWAWRKICQVKDTIKDYLFTGDGLEKYSIQESYLKLKPDGMQVQSLQRKVKQRAILISSLTVYIVRSASYWLLTGVRSVYLRIRNLSILDGYVWRPEVLVTRVKRDVQSRLYHCDVRSKKTNVINWIEYLKKP